MEFNPRLYLDEVYSDKASAVMAICQRLQEAANSKWTAADFTSAVQFVLALAEKAGFRIESSIPEYIPDRQTFVSSIRMVEAQIYSKFIPDEVDEVLILIEERTTKPQFGYAYLSNEEKRLIHEHLSAIRSAIEASNLDDRKRNAIMERINKLAAEIDKNGTGTDRFFAFMGDLALVAGQMKQRAKPALDEFKEILKILMKNRAKHEGAALPPGQEFPQLPTPDELRDGD